MSLAFEAIETIIYGNYQSSQSFVSSRIFLKRLGRSGRSYRKQALDVLSGVVNNKSTGNFQFSDAPVLASMESRPALPSEKIPTFPERRGWPYTTKTEEGLTTSDFQLPTSDFRLAKNLLGFSSTPAMPS